MLPKAGQIRVYEVSKIINSKKKLSISEQVDLLYKLQSKLVKKMKVLNKGYRIVDLKLQSYTDWKYKNGRTSKPVLTKDRVTSNIEEGAPISGIKTTEDATPLAAESLSPG